MIAGCAAPPPPPPPPPTLQEQCLRLIDGFDGEVGFYVRDLGTGETAAHRADEAFPTASMIKVPILLTVFDALERGDLRYREPLTYTRDRRYPGEDLLGSFADGEKIDIARLCLLMITMSDNSAALWLQELCGTGTAINAWLAGHGFAVTRMNSRTPGREDAQHRYGWGQTSPREMAELLVRIRDRCAVSPAADEEMHRILTRSFWDGEALDALPPSVQVMSKQGAVDHSRSEVFLVHAPSGDFVACLITKDQADTSWEDDNAGFRLLRAFAKTCWDHFEPDHRWAPAPGHERYR